MHGQDLIFRGIVMAQSLILYGIPNCDTCRKARGWLEGKGVAYRFHDLRENGLTATKVQRWLTSDFADMVVNRRSTTWRGLGEAQKTAGGAALVSLLVENPTLVKRPVIERDGEVLAIGFDQQEWSRAIR